MASRGGFLVAQAPSILPSWTRQDKNTGPGIEASLPLPCEGPSPGVSVQLLMNPAFGQIPKC
jgi:hypothetical protein